MQLSPEVVGRFDRVVMNPPFCRGRDLDHVRHALRFVAPGGRLVAIMSAGVAFREDVYERDAKLAQALGIAVSLPRVVDDGRTDENDVGP